MRLAAGAFQLSQHTQLVATWWRPGPVSNLHVAVALNLRHRPHATGCHCAPTTSRCKPTILTLRCTSNSSTSPSINLYAAGRTALAMH